MAHGGASLWPVQWQWSNFADGLDSFPFWPYLRNSLLSTLVPVVAVVFSSSLVGFAFARIRARAPARCSRSSCRRSCSRRKSRSCRSSSCSRTST
ncbi:hypothetical protein ACFQQB_54915 [Nonomuraea rubra]|uniref:hypothetical protein n=1 Tax=Nonomuraea rubra TaxID=46180 RepID=UPI003622A205